MPSDDDAMMARILHLNEQIVDFISSGYRDPVLREKALQASDELNTMLLPFVRMRRDDPQDDFISRVWQEAAGVGLELDEERMLGLCRELYFAGSDTTVHGIANALWFLLSHDELRQRVKADRGKTLANLIEESLRLLNVVQFRHRICMEDTVVDGVSIQKGETIFLVHAAANRDPERYGCPADLELERKIPTDHLAFAKGTRSCVGAQLARAEITEVINCLLDHFPEIRLDPDASAPQFSGLFMRSMRPLNVILC
jgi:cytochrome P450